MIPRALLMLLVLRVRGFFRRIFRKASGLRGALLLAVGAVLGLLWLTSIGMSLAHPRRSVTPRPEVLADVGPVLLLIATILPALLSSRVSLLTFSPAEVDQVMPGPFSRRQIMLYKIAAASAAAPFVALVFLFTLRAHGGGLAKVYFASVLAVLFVQLGAAAIALAVRLGGVAFSKRVRIVGAVVVAACVAGLGFAIVRAVNVGSAADAQTLSSKLSTAANTYRAFRTSLPAEVLLAVPSVFVRAAQATTWGSFAAYAALALLVNGAIVGLILRLDRSFLETAAAASAKQAEAAERVRRGGAFAAHAPSSGFALPGPPIAPVGSLRGAAMLLAHRQAQAALRGWKAWLLPVAIACLLIAFIPVSRSGVGSTAALLAPLVVIAVFMLPAVMRFDFRTDLRSIETLKALPLNPLGVAIGQLVVPTLAIGLLVAAMTTFAVVRGVVPAGIGAAVALGAIPVALLLITLENALFLLYPTASVGTGVLDLQRLGRQTILGIARFLLLGIVGGTAGVFAWALTAIAPLPAALGGAWIIVACGAAAGVAWTAHCYQRFDVARDMPPE